MAITQIKTNNMSKIQKTWGELVAAYNVAVQIVTNSSQELEKMKSLEKSDKSKEELKAEMELNAINKPLYVEMERIYSGFTKKVEDLVEEHREKVEEIMIDYALETEATPAKDGKPAVMKLLLNEKNEYCYDREGQKAKSKALKALNLENVMVPQYEVVTTITEKHELFEGFIILLKAPTNLKPIKSRTPVKTIRKR